MGMLPCSDVHYAGESDFPQQCSGTTRVHDGKTNCIEHGEVQVTDFKVDDLGLNVEGSRFEQGGDQWTVDLSPTSEGHYNGDSYVEFDVDGQKISCDSPDSEYSQDQCNGGSLVSESSQLPIFTTGCGLPACNMEETPSLSELICPEQDEPMAVWVKWRGMWQAGIQCARADWPLSTLKAKPTHGRKKYIVIFFPRRRNYSWADVLLVRPINEFPEPIPYRTHKVGVKMVKDLTLARRFIVQKLVISVINIVDQLHSEALIETARSSMVWKEFAMEASCCKGYSAVGLLLLKLQNMIRQCYLDPYWLQHSSQSWAQRCQNAYSAESVEMLKEELVDCVLWNEVSSLLNKVVQPELNSEWKTLKQEIMRSFTMSHPISSGGDLTQQCHDSVSAVESQISRKRPKLVVRRAEANTSQVESQCADQPMNVNVDSGFFHGRNIVDAAASSETMLSRIEVPQEGAVQSNSPCTEADRWGEIVIEAGNPEVLQSTDIVVTPLNGVATKSFDPGSKNNQCIAFIESKGRQCVRWANDGDVYCCVHLPSRVVSNSAKVEASPSDVEMCGGTTVLGTKCKHRALIGTSFCKKHRPQNDGEMMLSTCQTQLKRKHKESVHGSETTNCTDIVVFGESETPLHLDPISVMSPEGFNESNLLEISTHSRKENNDTEMLHCVGSFSQEARDPCLEIAKRHSLYCEKHLPSWLKRARNGKSRIISKEVFMDLLRDCYSREQKLQLHQACELFYKLFKSILSRRNPVPKEIQFQWAISEASKDARVRALLMKLVSNEKERLKKLWGFTTDKESQNCSSVEDPVPIPLPIANDNDHDNGDVIKCKICLNTFSTDQSLVEHWMGSHRKEAQWFFRGYACAICLDSFTNKKVLESHVQERHSAKFVEQCLLLQCIPCGSHFGNVDQLWLHVRSVHHSDFRLNSAAQQHNLISFGEDSSRKLPVPLDINFENQGCSRKFICKFCGLKFDLLPDLGRHHQAAHMGANPVGPRPPKRGISFYAHKLKSRRLTRPRFKKGLGAASYNIRNRAGASMRKRVQVSSLVSSEEQKKQSHLSEADNLGSLADSQCSAVAKMLFSEITKTKPRPSNFEILSLARSACCKVNLQTLLEQKYGILPERLYLKAAKLCSEHNILVYWHQDGFNCPKGCKRITEQSPLSPLLPHSDAVRVKSVNPLDSMIDGWELDESHYVVDSEHFIQEPIQRTIILCDDISFGQESVPVACVVDENLLGSLSVLVDGSDGQATYSMPWEGFIYVRKPLLDESLGDEAEWQSLQLGCTCAHSTCSSGTCDHVYLFDNDYEDAKDVYGKPMNGRFPYDDKGRIILEEGYLVYECNQKCNCSRTCQNRVLQNGVQVKLEVFKTEKKGWAVRAAEPILRGTFVCEYIGEVIDEQEATNRRKSVEGWSYFYEIDAQSNDMSRLIEEQVSFVIDATNYGNVSRYINHSCLPNLMNHQVLVESMDCQLAHIGLYASRDIAIGEELTYNYRYKLLPGEGCQCHCGAPNCRGRLY